MVDGTTRSGRTAVPDKPLTILLVEDNPDHAELVRRIMAEQAPDAVIIHLADGATALDYLHGHGEYRNRVRHPLPHLVLLDLRLPGIDGMEVLRQAKADSRLRTLPIVILTTSVDERDLSRARSYRASSYLAKSGNYSEFSRNLMASVQAAGSGRRPARAKGASHVVG